MTHLIATITDKELGFPFDRWEEKERRTAARAILQKDGKIALLHVVTRHHHKLPGGGVKDGEDIIAALQREVLEETGCGCQINAEIGVIVEHRLKQHRTQKSHYYFATVTEVLGEPELTPEEKAEGYSLMWSTIDEAIELMEKDPVHDYVGHFVRHRDLLFLKTVRDLQ